MSTTTPTDKSDSTHHIRPPYVPLGLDGRGAHHVYDTRTETVHIIHADGSRERRVIGATQSVDDWMDAVAAPDGWGWDTKRYGIDAYADAIAAALE